MAGNDMESTPRGEQTCQVEAPFKAVLAGTVNHEQKPQISHRESTTMEPTWRQHLVDEGDGTMRIKAHGMMKTDARLVTDAAHMKRHADDRGPEQLVNTAALPGIVGEAWAMADWHYGYGFPIGGVVATDSEAGELGGAISPGGVGFDINCGVRFLALDATAQDIPNLKKLAGRLAGRIPAGGSGKGGVDISHQDLNELLQRGAHAADDVGYGLHEDLNHLESPGVRNTDQANLSQRARERGLRSLGTLGSGNHFLELQTVGQVVDEATAKAWGLYEDQVVALIHSGSRGLGHQVCSDHVRTLEASYKLTEGIWQNETWGYELPDRQLAAAPVHSKEGQAYLDAMNAAAILPLPTGLFWPTVCEPCSSLNWALTVRREPCTMSLTTLPKWKRTSSTASHVHVAFIERAPPGHWRRPPRHWVSVSMTGHPLLFPATWATDRGSWQAQRKEQRCFWSSCHGAGRAYRGVKQRKPKTVRHSSECWRNRAFGFTLRHPTCFRRRPPTPTKTWTK